MDDANPYEYRLYALRNALESEGLNGAVLSRPQHLFYFTGIMPGASPAFLIISSQFLIAVSPTPLGNLETIIYPDYDIHPGWKVVESAAQAIEHAIQQSGLSGKNVGLELAHLPAAYKPTIQKRVRASCELEPLLWHIRRIKDATEIAQMMINAAGNDRIFQVVQQMLQPDLSELEVWSVVQKTLCENAGYPVTLEANLGVGPRSSNPDAQPGQGCVQAGDTVFLDVYSATQGYYADTTRVFTLGKPNSKQLEIHDLLVAAQTAGEEQLQPGVPAGEVDAAVRRVIERAGYGPNFPHHSGHAFGIFQQERPFLIPGEKLLLEEGMMLTLEPGIYIPGWGGMRIESNYLIGANGPQKLDHFPIEICVCP